MVPPTPTQLGPPEFLTLGAVHAVYQSQSRFSYSPWGPPCFLLLSICSSNPCIRLSISPGLEVALCPVCSHLLRIQELLIFQSVQPLPCWWDKGETSKLLTCGMGNWKFLNIIFNKCFKRRWHFFLSGGICWAFRFSHLSTLVL